MVAVIGLGACGHVDFDQADCVLWLRMDEPAWVGAPNEVVDSCGHNNASIVSGSPTTVSDPIRGQVGQFTGVDCLYVPDDYALHASSAVTMSAWVFANFNDGQPHGIISKRLDEGVELAYAMYIWKNPPTVWVDIDDENDRFAAPTPIPNGEWHQLTVVFDGGVPAAQRVRVYIDAALDFTAAETSPSIPGYTVPISIGCQPRTQLSEFWDGYLDDVAIWRHAFSEAEVASWYASTAK